jgi:hypothetical protein
MIRGFLDSGISSMDGRSIVLVTVYSMINRHPGEAPASAFPACLRECALSRPLHTNHSHSLTFPSKRLELAEAQCASRRTPRSPSPFQQRRISVRISASANGLAAGNRATVFAQEQQSHSPRARDILLGAPIDFREQPPSAENQQCLVPYFNA